MPDLQLRLALYRRLADLDDAAEIDAFGAELIDRFGPLPQEVEHLLKIVFIKGLCRKANVEKLDAGPKGVVIHFRKRQLRRSGRAGALYRRAGLDGEDPAGPECGLHPRLAEPGKAPVRLGGGDDATGAAGDEGGVEQESASPLVLRGEGCLLRPARSTRQSWFPSLRTRLSGRTPFGHVLHMLLEGAGRCCGLRPASCARDEAAQRRIVAQDARSGRQHRARHCACDP